MEATSEPHGYLDAHLRSTRDGLGYTRSTYAHKTFRTFGAHLPTDRSAPLLEIGPGECEFAELLQDSHRYTRLEVLDRSPDVGDEAAARRIRATVTPDTIGHLSRHAGQYQSIMMFHVLEHVPKTEIIPLLAAVRGALADGGQILLEVPNMGDPLNGLYFRYADFTHEVGFTEESLRYVLGQAGFRSIDFLPQVGASTPALRVAQGLSRRVLHGLLFVLNLPNGRQMRRQIGPVLSVRATT